MLAARKRSGPAGQGGWRTCSASSGPDGWWGDSGSAGPEPPSESARSVARIRPLPGSYPRLTRAHRRFLATITGVGSVPGGLNSWFEQLLV